MLRADWYAGRRIGMFLPLGRILGIGVGDFGGLVVGGCGKGVRELGCVFGTFGRCYYM